MDSNNQDDQFNKKSQFTDVKSERQRRSSVEEDLHDEYPMDNERQGRCLIFNHEKFDEQLKLKQRVGSIEDVIVLKDAFECLDFEVEVHIDLIKKEVLDRLKDVSKEDHTNADCLVVCLMTHGDRDNFYAWDTRYRKEKFWEFFLTKNCPKLGLKPKLFFIQACRGDKSEHRLMINLDHEEDAELLIINNRSELSMDSDFIPNPDMNANFLCFGSTIDFLLSFSSAEGYLSHRGKITGSPYIQYLASLLKGNGSKFDILVLLRKLTLLVGTRECREDPRKTVYLPLQTPFFTSSLTKALIFRKKRNQILHGPLGHGKRTASEDDSFQAEHPPTSKRARK